MKVHEFIVKVVIPIDEDSPLTEEWMEKLLYRPGGLFDSIEPCPDLSVISSKIRDVEPGECAID